MYLLLLAPADIVKIGQRMDMTATYYYHPSLLPIAIPSP